MQLSARTAAQRARGPEFNIHDPQKGKEKKKQKTLSCKTKSQEPQEHTILNDIPTHFSGGRGTNGPVPQ